MHETGVNFKRPQSINLHLTNHKMSSSSSSSLPDSVCANCDKGEECSGDLKSCTACQMVKYCNRDCQIAHRPQHKKACKKRATELFDKKLFKEHPPREDCPICFLPLPLDLGQSAFESCCGKLICSGCTHSMRETGGENMMLCPFCKTPNAESDEEEVRRTEKLMERGDAHAFNQLARYYDDGTMGLPQDQAKANELYLKAGELGHAEAYYNLGCSYRTGDGVEIDTKKAKQYWELAAMNGSEQARHNLGCMERQTGNDQRVKKHFLLAARAGHKGSLENIKQGFMKGLVTKEEYANTLREYQKSRDEMKSEARDKALVAPVL